MRVVGDALVYEAVTCAACGAKVREDRPRCLRCGRPLVPAHRQPARHAPVRAAGLLIGCLTIGVVGTWNLERGGANAEPGTSNAERGTPIREPRTPNSNVEHEPGTRNTERRTEGDVIAAFDSRRHGAAAYARGELDAALDEFSRAVEAHPEDAEALNNLGQVLVRSGRAAEAIPLFDEAIARAGDRWAYHFNRARAFAELQDWGSAIGGYRDAARLFPDDYVTQFNLARALQAGGDLAGAIAGFERAIELAPGEPDFHLSHAFALETAQRPMDALAAYRRFLELNPGAPQAEKISGRIAQLEGRAPASSAAATP
ncbi:MAG: tetratricopeptide repeat protein [Acidobacteria bacterium]|nr:tetratricopeptide repeat protein [Acidobacteriota bacterium]